MWEQQAARMTGQLGVEAVTFEGKSVWSMDMDAQIGWAHFQNWKWEGKLLYKFYANNPQYKISRIILQTCDYTV